MPLISPDKPIKKTKKIGRPSKYTPELGKEIGDAISSSELGLIHLVNANPHWPHRSTIFEWRLKFPEFEDIYSRAKQEQTEVVLEFMQELMNEPHKSEDPETGLVKIDVPMLNLKLNHMKWHAAKLKPKKFGDAKEQETNNSDIHDDCKKRQHELNEKLKKDY